MDIDELFVEARDCKLCYKGLPIWVPLPDPKNGKTNVKVIFINERPGRIGTGKSGYVSFDNDDPSARHFKGCFLQLGLTRKEIFITNACICHPQYESYKDKAPSAAELKNCHVWLRKQIAVTNPKLVVTIGAVALKSMKLLFPGSNQLVKYNLKTNIGEVITDTKPWIYPLYHTSLRARLTRSTEKQQKDWLKIKEILARL